MAESENNTNSVVNAHEGSADFNTPQAPPDNEQSCVPTAFGQIEEIENNNMGYHITQPKAGRWQFNYKISKDRVRVKRLEELLATREKHFKEEYAKCYQAISKNGIEVFNLKPILEFSEEEGNVAELINYQSGDVLTKPLHQQESEIVTLKKQLAEAQNKLRDTNADNLSNLKALETKYISLEENNKAEFTRLQQRWEKLKEETKDLDPNKEELVKERKPLDQERKPLDQEREQLDQERKPLDQERKQLDQERKQLDQERKQLDQERKQLDQERKQLDQERKQLAQLRKQLDQERKQLDQERKQLDQERKLLDQERKLLHLNLDKKEVKKERILSWLRKRSSGRLRLDNSSLLFQRWRSRLLRWTTSPTPCRTPSQHWAAPSAGDDTP